MLRPGILIAANGTLVFLIEFCWIQLAVRRQWGFVAKANTLATLVHGGLLLGMILWTAYFLDHAMPADLLSNSETRKHLFAAGLFAAGIFSWLIPMWIVIIFYKLRVFS